MERNKENNLKYSLHPLFGNFNGMNRKFILLFGSLNRRE